MIGFGGKDISNLMDFTVLLRTKKPGDQVDVTVLRNGQTIVVKVLLTARK
jgi:S1-C subfamily serine protease